MKKSIKIISLIIALSLSLSLIGMLVSCDSAYFKTKPDKIKDETDKLSNKMKREIQYAYYTKNKELCKSPSRVYGTCYAVFDDAYCLIINISGYSSPDVITQVEVSNYTFRFSTNNTMIVYCDGEFYSLKRAYETGILNDAELGELYAFYNNVQWGK